MINKFQQGGKQDAIMQFVQGLAQTLQADPQQVVQMAQQNPDALKSAVQVYQQTQDMNQAAQAFQQALQQQVRAAKHGAKLQYLKSLKNQCAEDEEIVYYKKGGSVDCGCIKKNQTGGKTPQKKTPVSKFKNDYSSKRVRESEEDYFRGYADHERYKPLKQELPKKKTQISGTVKKEVNKFQKIKKHEQGAKINPIIAKFKASRQ